LLASETRDETATADLAAAIVALVGATAGGTYHLVNGGHASRFEWAEHLLRGTGRATPLEPISQRAFQRPSKPPAWGVLATDRAASVGVRLRPWQQAVDDELARSIHDPARSIHDPARSPRAVARQAR
jgi:dTDP-4-dehydrorhamnose reductase